MHPLPYIPGLSPAEPGPLSRFIPPLEQGVAAAWLARHPIPPGTWLLDPFGFAPQLAIEAARSGYRVLVTANNPITRFLLEMAARPPIENDFTAALAALAVSKKGSERIEMHIQSLYLTRCDKCEREIQVESFLWRKDEDQPFARIYKCPNCEDAGERPVKPEDIERAHQIAASDGLHRSRALERVASIQDDYREHAEEALKHYLPRPLYVLTTLINRMEALNLPDHRRKALTALLLAACDAGNTMWGHPSERPRPKQLYIPAVFREQNLWLMLENKLITWIETGASVTLVNWPSKIAENGGICLFEGRLSQLAHQVRRQIPIAAVLTSLPRPNQAFWTLSALWSGWLWGREAVEPFKAALRRRRYDWGWSATALHSAFSHLFGLLPSGTAVLGLLPEPEPPFLTCALTAAEAGGFDLKGLAMRTADDPIQILWESGEHLQRETHKPVLEETRQSVVDHLKMRGEPTTYFNLHAAALIDLASKRALRDKGHEIEQALRLTNSLIQNIFLDEALFEHYSSGASVETGFWGLKPTRTMMDAPGEEPLADRVEIAVVNYLQKNTECIFLELENQLYPLFPGLLTPSQGILHAVLDSYALREGSLWTMRAEDATKRRAEAMEEIARVIEAVGKRLDLTVRSNERLILWEEKKQLVRAFYILGSALLSRAINNIPYHPDQVALVIPGGRAALAAYKSQRDPALYKRLQPYRLVKYRLLRAIAQVPVLTRETFEEQLRSDPIEQSRGQLMMF
jgi:hypothetical protein